MDEVLPLTASVTDEDHLSIGGCDVVDLAARFGTPLIVFDRTTFEDRARAYASALSPDRVFYAGKAFCRIVVDSFEEFDRLVEAGVRTNILVRITPGVEAHTHEFVQTGQEDSKFGFGLVDGLALEALKRAVQVPGCDLVGVHAHIGSQIFELAAFDLAIRRLAEFLARAKDELSFEARELNLGGGLGIAHTHDELTPAPAEAIGRMQAAIEREFLARDLAVPRLFVEPGRSIVGSAAVTVYEVGSVKRIPGVRTYVSVDGGMSDNIRPALYGARYEAFMADRVGAPPGPRVTVAGKHCESGDVLIRDAHLPDDIAPGNLLCIPATGAYTYSMLVNVAYRWGDDRVAFENDRWRGRVGLVGCSAGCRRDGRRRGPSKKQV